MEEKTPISWSFVSLEMLAELHDYISENSNESSADKYLDGLINHIERLADHPESCPPCRNQKLKKLKYRCCNFKNHIIIYEYRNAVVNILAIIHAKRQPDDLDI